MSCVCVSGFLLVLLLGVLVHFLWQNEEKKIERPDFVMGFCADEAHGDWNMETDIRCFWTSPVEVLTEVILAGIIAYRLQILYITTVFRRLTPPLLRILLF